MKMIYSAAAVVDVVAAAFVAVGVIITIVAAAISSK